MSHTHRKRYSQGEEVADSITKGIGVGLSVAALSILVTIARLNGDIWRVVTFSILFYVLPMENG